MRPSPRLAAALLALGLASFTYVTAESLPIGLLPLMARGLHVSESQVGFLVTAYGLVVVLASIPLTQLTRHVRRRSLLTVLVAAFVLATAASAVAPTYETMLVARIVTGLSQALFWSIIVPAAASLAPPDMRGRAIAVVFGGSSLAAVAGVPFGSWLGDFAGWRLAFASLACVGVVTFLAIAALLPADPPSRVAVADHARRSLGPYMRMVLSTALVTTGAFAAFTYVAPYLIDVAGFRVSAVGPLLLVRGLAGLAGVAIGGRLADRSSATSMNLAITAQAVGLLGMAAIPDAQFGVVACLALSGLAFSALTAALGARIIDLAPGNVDLAAAGTSTAVNVGITCGALLGGLLLPLVGARTIVFVGEALTFAGLVVALSDRRRPRLRVHSPGQEEQGELAA